MRLSDLVESIGKKPLPPGTTHLVVEMLVSDEEGEDVDVRQLYDIYEMSDSLIDPVHIGLHLEVFSNGPRIVMECNSFLPATGHEIIG